MGRKNSHTNRAGNGQGTNGVGEEGAGEPPTTRVNRPRTHGRAQGIQTDQGRGADVNKGAREGYPPKNRGIDAQGKQAVQTYGDWGEGLKHTHTHTHTHTHN